MSYFIKDDCIHLCGAFFSLSSLRDEHRLRQKQTIAWGFLLFPVLEKAYVALWSAQECFHPTLDLWCSSRVEIFEKRMSRANGCDNFECEMLHF